MRIPLATLAKQQGVNRKSITLRAIIPPQAMAGELARIHAQATAIWAARLPRIMAEYERTLSELSQDSARDVRHEIDAASNETQNVFAEVTAKVVRWVNRVEQWHRDKWAQIVAYPTRVNLATILTSSDVAETVEMAIARNVALIKDVTAQAQARISDSIFRGLQQRTPARQVARELQDAVGLARKRSIRIASDQLQKVTSTLDRERMTQAGIEEYEWQHSGKLHPREEHLERDGNEYPIGEPDDEPGELPFCGCKRRALLKLD